MGDFEVSKGGIVDNNVFIVEYNVIIVQYNVIIVEYNVFIVEYNVFYGGSESRGGPKLFDPYYPVLIYNS